MGAILKGLSEKTTVLLGIVGMVCVTVLIAFGKVDASILKDVIPWLIGAPAARNIAGAMLNANPPTPEAK